MSRRWNQSTEDTYGTPSVAEVWSHKEHTVVGIGGGSPKARPVSRQFARGDDFSVLSTSTRQSYRWDRRLQKPVEIDEIVRWDRKTKTPTRKKLFQKNGPSTTRDCSTSGSPKAIVIFEDLSSEKKTPKPTGIKVVRPKSADTAARKKKMKELEVKTMLIRMSSRNSGRKLDFSEGEKSPPTNAKLADMNAILEKKNKLLEEQQLMIRDLTKEIQSISPKADTKVPDESIAPEDRPLTPMSNLGSIFSAMMAPLFDQSKDKNQKQ